MRRLYYFVLHLAFAFGLIYAQETASIADTNASEPKLFVGVRFNYHYGVSGFKIGYLPWKMEAAMTLFYKRRQLASEDEPFDEDYSASLSLSREVLKWQKNRIKSNFSLGLGSYIGYFSNRYHVSGNLLCKFGFEYIINESFGLEISNNSYLTYRFYEYYDEYEIEFQLISSSLYIKYYF